MRESAHSKGRRYLTEGRLLVIEVDQNRIRSLCRGDGSIWSQSYNGQEWVCDCPAARDQCSHLIALRLVTIADPRLVGADVRIGSGDASRFEARR